MDYMREKLMKEEESKKQRFDIQKELQVKKEEVEVRKLEATNERLRLEAMQRENKHRAEMEEKRREEHDDGQTEQADGCNVTTAKCQERLNGQNPH
ncbi:hypothetical protein BaRGS_00027572 [Batillaria attramentaria]|uniref:Uncharacterized protein n=1 Tax=Batillaria attramentaria TaxID=370345 RepID=A0ABD0K260_9CAEN